MDCLSVTESGIKIIYEDNHLIVAVKPAGMLSQSDITGAPDMLTELKKHLKVKYNKPGDVFLGLVHRLDRPVSGVMVFARTSKAASRLSEQIRNRKFTKKYRAVVLGQMRKDGSIESYISKDSKTNTVVCSDKRTPGAKLSSLDYKVITGNSEYTLLDIDLHTGRSHQIRAQLASIGHPIVCDRKYGNDDTKGDIALESYLLEFKHPTRDEVMRFELEPSERFIALTSR